LVSPVEGKTVRFVEIAGGEKIATYSQADHRQLKAQSRRRVHRYRITGVRLGYEVPPKIFNPLFRKQSGDVRLPQEVPARELERLQTPGRNLDLRQDVESGGSGPQVIGPGT
jgi:hypothetical protein